jgi:hypothetical protein
MSITSKRRDLSCEKKKNLLIIHMVHGNLDAYAYTVLLIIFK